MKISPLDIKKQEFEKKFRGYDPEEVNSYLNQVADELEEVLKENKKLQGKIDKLQDKLDNYTQIENVLQDTLLTTQKSAEEKKSVAEQKAKSIIDEAKAEEQKILANARERLIEVRKEITDLRNQRDAFVVNFKSLLETQKMLLELVEKRSESGEGFPKIPMKSDMTDEDLERVVREFEEENKSQPESEFTPNNSEEN